jgi:hypothetical protein
MAKVASEISAAFADAIEAEAALAEIRRAGVPAESIAVQHDVLAEAIQRESRFIGKVLLMIVLWSIAGAVPGAILGWVLWQTMGPEGTAGLVLQVVCWAIVGHLLGGMLAGYFLLADRTEREMPPDRPLTVVTVSDLPDGRAEEIERLLRSHGALEVQVTSSRVSSRTL